MALVPCPKCGKRISDRAPACPFCKWASAAADSPSQLAVAAVSQQAPPVAAISAPAPPAAPAARPAPPAPPAAPHRVALAAPYQPGDAIGERYRVLRLLGEGGFGLVYLAVQRSGGAVRAVKTVRDELVRDDKVRALFRKEAEIWIALGRHPFLVQANEVFEDDGRLFIAMEFVAPPPGGFNSLQEHLQRRALPLEQTLRWAVQVCHGMEHAYSRGIRCHRDLKPANVLIGPDENVRISDFGIAGVIAELTGAGGGEAAAAGATVAGTVFGTPTHMPPEQFEGVEACDERSDVYAFGVVLHQMVAGGALPFLPRVAPGPDAGARMFHELRRLHREAAPARLDSPLWPLIERCLRKPPAQRYQGFAALRAALEPLLAAHGGEAVVVPGRAADEAWDHASRAVSLSGLDRLPEALAAYENALALLPDEPRLLSGRGNVLRRLGRLDEAHASLDRALALAPERDEIWLNKGLAWNDAGRRDEALRCFDEAVARNARSNDAWTAKGVMLWRLDRHAEAMAAFDSALSADPRDARAWSNKAGLLLEAGRLEEARACSEKSIGLDPRNAAYWDGHGTTLGALGRQDEALAAHAEAVRLDPSQAQFWYNRGNALVQSQRYEEALDCFERACSRNPGAATPWYNRALCLLMFERAPEALDCLKKYFGRAPADDVLRAGAQQLAQGIESGALKGLARDGTPKVGALRDARDRVVDRATVAAGVEAQARAPRLAKEPGAHEIPAALPGHVHRPGPEVARHPATADVGVRSHATGELNGRGSEFYAQQRYAEALACFDKALALDSRHARAHGNRANTLHALERLEEALAAVREALRIEPGLAAFWHSKAHIELGSGQAPQAATSFREFVALAQGGDFAQSLRDAQTRIQRLNEKKVTPAPRDALAWAATGCRHGADERFQEAVEAFDKGLRLEPGCATLWRLRGDAYNHAGDYDAAVASFDRALAVEPQDARTWHGKALALARHRRFDEALAAFDEALRQDPDHAASWADRGRYLGAVERLEESIASIECASLLAPENPGPWWNRALAEDQLDWLPEAARSYRRFLERAGPEQAPQIESARDRIAVLPPPAPDPPVLAALLKAVPPPAPAPAPPPRQPAVAPAAPPPAPFAILPAVVAVASAQAPPGSARAVAEDARRAGDRERAGATLQAHLAGAPDDGAAWLELALDLRALGRLDAALAALDKAQPLVSDAVPVLAERGLILNAKGVLLCKQQRFAEALACFDLLLAARPGDLLALFNKGECLEQAGRPGDAAVAFARYLTLAKASDPRVGPLRARVQALRGQAQDAALRPGAVAAAAPSPEAARASAAGALKKARFCLGQGQRDKALEWFEVVLRADPAHADALTGKGECLSFFRRSAEALACFEGALAVRPQHGKLWQMKGACLQQLVRPDEALAAFERAVECDPQNPGLWTSRGIGLMALGRTDEAIACHEKALAIEPRSPLPKLELGKAFELQDRRDEAARAYQQFLALAPVTMQAQVQEARARLQALRS